MMINSTELEQLIAAGDREALCHSLCDCGNVYFESGAASAIPSEFRVVLAVEMFYGGTMKGGLEQFLSDDHAALAVHAVDALEKVGLPLPADVLQKALQLFPTEVQESPDPEYFKYFETIEEEFGSGYIENEIEQKFWDWYYNGHEDEIRNRLHVWIVSNESSFTAKR